MPTTAPIKVPILSQDKWTKDFNRLHQSFAAMGAVVSKAGKTVTRSVTLPIAVAGFASLKMAKDFNSAMGNVGTLIPGQTKRLQDLKEKLLDLSKVTATNERELAEGGLYQTISAFGDSVETMGRLAIVAKAAKAGVSTTAESLNLLSSVTQGFGDTSEKAVQKAADLAFLTVKLGKTTFPELASSMGRDVAMADALKVSQEELFASFATLTSISETAEVATQLASLFGALIKPTEGMSKAAKKLGFESSVAMIRELGFTKTIQSLAQVTGGSTEKLGKLITRKEGLQAVLALTGSQADTYIKKLDAMSQSSGALDDAFKAQTEGINKTGFAFDQSVQQIRVMFIEIGDKLMPVLAKLLPHVSSLIDKFNSLSDEQLETRLKIIGLVATIGPLVLILGKTMGAISGVITVFGKLKDLQRAYLLITGKAVLAQKAQALSLAETSTQAEIAGAKLSVVNKEMSAAKWGASVFGSVLVGGLLGWEIGTLIHDNFIEPIAKSRDELAKLKIEISESMKKLDTKKDKVESVLANDLKIYREELARLQNTTTELEKNTPFFKQQIEKLESYIKKTEALYKPKYLKRIDKEIETSYGQSTYMPDIIDKLWSEDRSIDSNVTVVLEGLPGVRAKVKSGKNVKSVDIEHKGSVMEDAL